MRSSRRSDAADQLVSGAASEMSLSAKAATARIATAKIASLIGDLMITPPPDLFGGRLFRSSCCMTDKRLRSGLVPRKFS
jgi:hypothetical protein